MSFMNLRMIPGEAMLEDVETILVATTPEEVTGPEDIAVMQQYQKDPTTPYRKTINKLLPMNDMVEHILREVQLVPEDIASAVNDLNFIKDTATCIAECMPVLVSKLSACLDIFRDSTYANQMLIANAKIFMTKSDKIKRLGLSKYRAVHHNSFPVLENYESIRSAIRLFDTFCPGDDTVLSIQAVKTRYEAYNSNELDYFESLSDLINVACHPESERFERLCNIDERSYDIFDIFSQMETRCSAQHSLYGGSLRPELICSTSRSCAKMLRFVSMNIYDLMICIDDYNDVSDNKYYRETLRKIVAAVCNTYYICAMVVLSTSLTIERRIADKNDLDAHVAKIVAEVK